MGFVVGYALCGLSPQIDGMPVIPTKTAVGKPIAVLHFSCDYAVLRVTA